MRASSAPHMQSPLFRFTKRVAVERALRLSGLSIDVMYGCMDVI